MTFSHLFAGEALAVQHGNLALGAVDRFVDQVELDLELLALFDLRAIGIERRLHVFGLRTGSCLLGGFAVRRAPICARIARSSLMISL